MSNMLLETGGKAIHVTHCQITELNCALHNWKAEFINYKLRYLDENISKQIVEYMPWFLLMAYSKMREERNDLKMECVMKREAE